VCELAGGNGDDHDGNAGSQPLPSACPRSPGLLPSRRFHIFHPSLSVFIVWVLTAYGLETAVRWLHWTWLCSVFLRPPSENCRGVCSSIDMELEVSSGTRSRIAC